MKRIVFSLLIAIVACSDVNLVPPEPGKVSSKGTGDFCTYDPETKEYKTNILVIIDYSASNRDTDNGKVRVDKTREFFEKNEDENVRWSFVAFDTNAEAVIKDGNQGVFTEETARVEAALNELKGKSQNGATTNYEAALTESYEMIEYDKAQFPDREDHYYILFLSDGQPNSGASSEGSLRRKVQELMQVSPGRIFLSTGYYGRTSTKAQRIMEAMAEEGRGSFFNFDRAEDIDLGKFIIGVDKQPWVLKHDTFVVYNLSSAICSDGYFDTDSDADGVCDKDEEAFGLDPTKRSSPQWDEKTQRFYNTGYSDYFHLLEKQGLIVLPPCKEEDRVDEDFDLLNNCEENLLHNESPRGTEWPKGKVWKTGNPKDPDTDNDGILDGIEVLVFKTHFGWALDNEITKDYDNEGISAFQQIQQHRNPLEWDPDAFSYDVLIKSLSQDEGKFCYSYEQSRLQLHDTKAHVSDTWLPSTKAGQNLVLVYFMQNKFKDPNGKGIYMFSVQALNFDPRLQDSGGYDAGLIVKDHVFTPYETYLKLEANE